MEAAAADGIIVAVQDVLLEFERQDDDVFAWAKRHVTFVLTLAKRVLMKEWSVGSASAKATADNLRVACQP